MELIDEFIILPLIIGGSLAGGLILRLLRHRDRPGATSLIVAILLGSLWAILYAMELLERDYTEKLHWAKLQYICIAGMAPTWFTYIVTYIRSQGPNRGRGLHPRIVAALYIFPGFVQPLVWLNEHHGLLWPSVELSERGDISILIFSHGPLYYAISGYTLTLLGIGSLLLLRFALAHRNMFFGHRVLILASTVLPVIAHLVYSASLPELKGIDPTPFTLIFAVCLLAYAMVRYGGVEVVALARDQALEMFPHGVLVLKGDLSILDTNEQGQRLLGRPRAAVLGQFLGSVFATKPDLGQELANNNNLECASDVEWQHPNGARLLLRVNARALGDPGTVSQGYLLLIEDVTREREMEAALRESEIQYRLLINNVPAAVYCSQGWPHDHAGYFSDFVEQLTGYPASEFAPAGPRAFGSLIHKNDYARIQSQDDRMPGQGLEYRIVHVDGSIRWVLDRAERPGKAGRDGKVDGILLDITEQKHNEKLLRTARDDAEAANRAKSAFLANMSHEIRTPMNGILGMAEVLVRSGLSEEHRNRATLIVQSGEQLLSILNDILDLSKIESGKMHVEHRPFHLGEALWECVALVAESAGQRGIALEVDLAPDLPAAIVGDAVKLQQVINNMLSNSLKFTHEGRIQLKACTVNNSGATEIQFDVIDTGIGMDAEQLARITHAFEQADTSTTRRYGGSGLGLTISVQLLEMMGGTLTLESAPGAGTAVHIRLPVKLPTAPLEAAHHTSVPDTAARLEPLPWHVLVVDDNHCNREVAIGLLEGLFAHLDVAENGHAAVQRAQLVQYDAILMDVHMPVMDGCAATREIRALGTYANVPIIAMTASAMQEDRERCQAAGMTGFLAKPIRVAELHALVRHLADANAPDLGASSEVLFEDTAPIHDGPDGNYEELPVFDQDEFEEVLGKSAALIKTALENFRPALRRSLGEFHQAAGAGDLESAHRGIHSLKSIAAYLGGQRLRALAAYIEDAYRNGREEGVAELLPEIAVEVEALEGAIQEYQAGNSAALRD